MTCWFRSRTFVDIRDILSHTISTCLCFVLLMHHYGSYGVVRFVVCPHSVSSEDAGQLLRQVAHVW